MRETEIMKISIKFDKAGHCLSFNVSVESSRSKIVFFNKTKNS